VPVTDMEFRVATFVCILKDGALTAKTPQSFGSAQEARDAFEPYMRAWRVWSQVFNNVVLEVTFRTAGGSLVERPRPAVAARLPIVGDREGAGTPIRSAPPVGIGGAKAGIDYAAERWADVLAGRESLSSGAYGVLTVLEQMY